MGEPKRNKEANQNNKSPSPAPAPAPYSLTGYVLLSGSTFEIRRDTQDTGGSSCLDLLRKGMTGEALRCYNKLLEQNVHDEKIWNNRGAALHALNNFEEALESYEKALQIAPDYPIALFNRGVAQLMESRFADALESFDKFLQNHPDDVQAWYFKGLALHNMSRYKEALECCERASQSNPDNESIWIERGINLFFLKRSQEALECYDKALQINPQSYKAWNNIGVVLHHQLGLGEKALKCYEKALQIQPNLASIWLNKSIALHSLGRYEEAEKCEREAEKLSPNNPFFKEYSRKRHPPPQKAETQYYHTPKGIRETESPNAERGVGEGENNLLERIISVMRENQKFLLPDSNPQNKSVVHEVLGLISDSDRHTRFFTRGEAAQSYGDSCIRPYVLLILRPFSHAIYADLLSSNTVSCFMELRLIVESLVKFYYADMKYPKKASFRGKIRLLEEDMRRGEKSLSDLVRECGWEKSTKMVENLWKQLSEGWLHTRGIVERIADEVASKTGIPAWLRGYQAYTQADLGVLQDLRKTIAAFRPVQAKVIENWKNLFQNQSPKAEEPAEV